MAYGVYQDMVFHETSITDLRKLQLEPVTTATLSSLATTEGDLLYDTTEQGFYYKDSGVGGPYRLLDTKNFDNDSIKMNGSDQLFVDIDGQADIGASLSNTDYILIWDVTAGDYVKATVAQVAGATGSGEVNTGSSIGTGCEVFAGKVGVDLQFRDIAGTEGVACSIDGVNNNVDIFLDIDNLTSLTGATTAVTDLFLVYDSSASTHKTLTGTQLFAFIDHDLIKNYVANEHIDHTSVNISAGTGMSGGGNIASSVTLNFEPDTLSTTTITTSDHFVISDVSDAGNPKRALASNVLSSLKVPRFYSETPALITGGVAYTVNHNLNIANQNNVVVQVYYSNSLINVDIDTTSVNALTVTSSIDLANAHIVVIGY